MNIARFAALLAVLAAGRPVVASEACRCPRDFWSIPPEGATNVPTNVRIFLSARGDLPDALYDGNESIPVVAKSADGGTGVWLIPTQPLKPSTTYTYYGGDFTTGAGPDDSPPAFGGLLPSPKPLYGACTDQYA